MQCSAVLKGMGRAESRHVLLPVLPTWSACMMSVHSMHADQVDSTDSICSGWHIVKKCVNMGQSAVELAMALALPGQKDSVQQTLGAIPLLCLVARQALGLRSCCLPVLTPLAQQTTTIDKKCTRM